MTLKSYLEGRQTLINRALGRYLPSPRQYPGRIHEAMRYSVLGTGKRIRPILTLAACEAAGGKLEWALPSACALELIHAYSLVHDDLPAMDNDDFRRGRPSCHKRFGEAIGVLTGDALLTFAFEMFTRGNTPQGNGSASSSRSHHDPTTHLKVIREVARAIGTDGMIGGQVVDVAFAERKARPKTLEYIHARKTGALIACSVRVGALLGGAPPPIGRLLSGYGRRVGLVFQLVDDLLDSDGAVRIYGEQTVRRKAQRLTDQAVAALAPLKRKAEVLRELARFILTRES